MKRISMFILYLTCSVYAISQSKFIDTLESLSFRGIVDTKITERKGIGYFDLMKQKLNFRVENDNELMIYINGNSRFSVYHIFPSDAFNENVQDPDVGDWTGRDIYLFDKIESRCYLLQYTWTEILTNYTNVKNNKTFLWIPLNWYLDNMSELNENFEPLSRIEFLPTDNVLLFKYNISGEQILAKRVIRPYDLNIYTASYDDIKNLFSWTNELCYDTFDRIELFPMLSLETGVLVPDTVLTSENYNFLLITPCIQEIDRSTCFDIIEVFDYCTQYGYGFYWLTASSNIEIDQWKNEEKLQYPLFPYRRIEIAPLNKCIEYPFHRVDEMTLNNLIKSDYGALLIKDGDILEEWESCFPELMHSLSIQKEVKVNQDRYFPLR